MGGVGKARVQFPAPRTMKPILYTKTGCPWCGEVRDFFDEKKVSYEEREVRGDRSWFAEMVQKSGQEKTPTLDWNGEILADTDVESVEKFLKDKKVLSS